MYKDWLKKKKRATSPVKDESNIKPKTIIDPPGIVLRILQPGETKKTSFLVINVGGSYSRINISNPDSWVKISDWHSISRNDELPLKVNIIAQADNSNKKRSEKIYVQLDDVQTYINVVLEPKMRLEITDHNWHDVGFDDLNIWAQGQVNSGKSEFKGTYFEYRFNHTTKKHAYRLRNKHKTAIYTIVVPGKYQFRLQHKHKCSIYAP
jgi:hypothetical protein